MTAKAYVLIEAQVGKTKQVVEAIRKLHGVVSVDAVTGPYDAIAIIQGETLNDIGELIVLKVHPVAGISRTVTCLAVAV
ncbi:MAG TPA: Lrp/AsnC ligand binding domain-containing protein [Dehalococcoidia bacterium]|nr:Lrp/AsnC ligand binding domain-containing protein [Dehalococcoidia bacterium]